MTHGVAGDFRLAVRSLRAAPAVTLAAALTLALGIGATTAIFSVADGLILRPLSALSLALVAAMPGWIPAWRATRIDPARVLREN